MILQVDDIERLVLIEALGLLWGDGRRRLKELAPGAENSPYAEELRQAVGLVQELRERVSGL